MFIFLMCIASWLNKKKIGLSKKKQLRQFLKIIKILYLIPLNPFLDNEAVNIYVTALPLFIETWRD